MIHRIFTPTLAHEVLLVQFPSARTCSTCRCIQSTYWLTVVGVPLTSQRNSRNTQRKKLTDFYDLGEEIGKGGFGVVRLATDKESGRRFACKIINVTEKNREHILDEVRVLDRLRNSRHVAQLHEVFYSCEHLFILTVDHPPLASIIVLLFMKVVPRPGKVTVCVCGVHYREFTRTIFGYRLGLCTIVSSSDDREFLQDPDDRFSEIEDCCFAGALHRGGFA